MIFRDADCGAVPVVDAGKTVGVLTDRDVALALAEHPDLAVHPVSDVMTPGAITVVPTTPLEDLRTQFAANGVMRSAVKRRATSWMARWSSVRSNCMALH